MSAIDFAACWTPVRSLRLCLLLYWCVTSGLDTQSQASLATALAALTSDASGAKDTMPQSSMKGSIAQMRDTGSNALHTSRFVLQMPVLTRCLRIMVRTMAPHRLWHGLQSKGGRSVGSSHRFYSEQVGGECVRALFETWQCMSGTSTFYRLGFAASTGGVSLRHFLEGSELILDESEWMAEWFALCVQVNFNRLRS